MKSYALAIGLGIAVTSVGAVYAFDRPSFYNAEDGRYLDVADHFAASRYHSKDARGAMMIRNNSTKAGTLSGPVTPSGGRSAKR